MLTKTDKVSPFQPVDFDPSKWSSVGNASPMNSNESVITDIGSGYSYMVYEGHDEYELEPHFNDGSDWILEVAFKAANYLTFSGHSATVFSRHGMASGWEVRITQSYEIDFVFTTDGRLHDDLKSKPLSSSELNGNWYHVFVIYRGVDKNLALYVNGKKEAQSKIRGDFIEGYYDEDNIHKHLPIQIGLNRQWKDRYFDGSVAYARVRRSWGYISGYKEESISEKIMQLSRNRLDALNSSSFV